MTSGMTRAIAILAATGFVFLLAVHSEAVSGRRQGCLSFENNRVQSVTVGFSGSSFDHASPVTLAAFERRVVYEATNKPVRVSEETVMWERAGSQTVNRYPLRDDPNARFVESTVKGCLGYAWVKSYK
jgi:hypothetical protein